MGLFRPVKRHRRIFTGFRFFRWSERLSLLERSEVAELLSFGELILVRDRGVHRLVGVERLSWLTDAVSHACHLALQLLEELVVVRHGAARLSEQVLDRSVDIDEEVDVSAWLENVVELAFRQLVPEVNRRLDFVDELVVARRVDIAVGLAVGLNEANQLFAGSFELVNQSLFALKCRELPEFDCFGLVHLCVELFDLLVRLQQQSLRILFGICQLCYCDGLGVNGVLESSHVDVDVAESLLQFQHQLVRNFSL